LAPYSSPVVEPLPVGMKEIGTLTHSRAKSNKKKKAIKTCLFSLTQLVEGHQI